jgi:hypothetical protein
LPYKIPKSRIGKTREKTSHGMRLASHTKL